MKTNWHIRWEWITALAAVTMLALVAIACEEEEEGEEVAPAASPSPVSEEIRIEETEVPQEPEEPEVPVQEPLPSPQSSVQEINLEQSIYPGYFSPDPVIVKKGIPVRILATTKQREHINRISIQPWISRSDTLSPGEITIIEFTPDQTGEFEIRNIGHGFTGILKVIE
jgi:hypothetical protein